MHLDAEEQAMRAGELGEPRRFAIEQQVAVGTFFDAADFVPVTQVHLMADGEALGQAGVDLLERLAAAPAAERRVRVSTVTDPTGVDPAKCKLLGQPAHALARDARVTAALQAMGVLMTRTCINYQTVLPPLLGEHLAYGDTGSVIYANSVCGARSNFEGGPAALCAALTGRTPRYGFHLPQRRLGTRAFELRFQPRDYTDWGAVGGIIGRRMRSYWEVPVVLGVAATPGSNALKFFGAALASYGSTAMFHMLGVTPEAPDMVTACGGTAAAVEVLTRADLDAFYATFSKPEAKVDLVVFTAPQLSLPEMQTLADALDGRQVHAGTTLIATTSPEVARSAASMGLRQRIEAAGGIVIEGACFYQMYAREVAEARGWKRLVTNSAKLGNIISGYGYEPVLAPLERCIEAAVRGRL